MCVISINVDEATLRDLRPELDTTAAIRLWAQELVDLRLQQMRMEVDEALSVDDARAMTHRAVSREYALGRDMTPEQLYAVISEEIDDIYANG